MDQYVPPAELSSHTVRAFADLGPKGNPGEIPTWTWTACKEEGLEGEERRRKQRSESESYMCLFFSIFNTSSFTFFSLLFSAAGSVSNVTVYWAACRYCYFTMDMGLQEILIFYKKAHTHWFCVWEGYIPLPGDVWKPWCCCCLGNPLHHDNVLFLTEDWRLSTSQSSVPSYLWIIASLFLISHPARCSETLSVKTCTQNEKPSVQLDYLALFIFIFPF